MVLIPDVITKRGALPKQQLHKQQPATNVMSSLLSFLQVQLMTSRVCTLGCVVIFVTFSRFGICTRHSVRLGCSGAGRLNGLLTCCRIAMINGHSDSAIARMEQRRHLSLAGPKEEHFIGRKVKYSQPDHFSPPKIDRANHVK